MVSHSWCYWLLFYPSRERRILVSNLISKSLR